MTVPYGRESYFPRDFLYQKTYLTLQIVPESSLSQP